MNALIAVMSVLPNSGKLRDESELMEPVKNVEVLYGNTYHISSPHVQQVAQAICAWGECDGMDQKGTKRRVVRSDHRRNVGGKIAIIDLDFEPPASCFWLYFDHLN
jgi:hypothetical protein